MNLRAVILALALFYKTRKDMVPIEEIKPEVKVVDFEEVTLDLPPNVVKITLTAQGYVTEPSRYPLPWDLALILQDLIGTRAWYSPVLKYYTEDDWYLILTDANYKEAFERKVRLTELKFAVLGKKP